MSQLNKSLGQQRNKLLRYQLIKNLYNETIKQHPHTPLTKILEVYIRPVYPISRTTLYEILCTNVQSELKAVEQQINSQGRLFN